MTFKVTSIYFFIILIFSTSCSSSTMIRSQPSGAKVYADGEYIGKTPISYSDQKIVGSSTKLTFKKSGCEEEHHLIQRNEEFQVGPCIGGVLVLFPFLWIMGYKNEHNYELSCKN